MAEKMTKGEEIKWAKITEDKLSGIPKREASVWAKHLKKGLEQDTQVQRHEDYKTITRHVISKDDYIKE